MRPLAILLGLLAAAPTRAATYEVGPTSTYTSIGAVPWESLGPGDTVRIHARAQPYAEKWVICARGTAEQPVRVVGVPDGSGNLPVITAVDATTRSTLRFANQERAIIKVGSASVPACDVPTFVTIENLHLTGARSSNHYTGPTGSGGTYAAAASTIYVQAGQDITIRGCILENSGNGLFSWVDVVRLTVENNLIQNNGNVGSIFEHNVYTAARGIVFRGNRLLPLCAGCSGNNLKDRSEGTVIQANWIEGGNRQLDLVECEDDPSLASDAAYGDTYVAGNVLIENAGDGNAQMVHFGGDHDGTNIPIYRPRLWFWNNTVISWRTDRTTLFRLSTPNQQAHLHNNVFWASAGGSSLAMVDEDGVVTYGNNWLPTGWKGSHGTVAGTLTNAGGNLTGSAPGFVDAAGRDFRLATEPASPCIGAAGVLPSQTTARPLEVMYVPHQQTTSKAGQVPSDLGAFWAGGGTPPPPPPPVTPPSTPASGGGATGGCGLGVDPGSGWLAIAGLAALRWRQVRRAGAAPAR